MEVDEKVVIEWAREKYPQYLENIDLLKSLYKRQVLKQSVFVKRSSTPFRRLKDIKVGERGKVKAVVVEIRRTGVKNKKWSSVILGDTSGMVGAMIFQDKDEDDLVEGDEYIFIVSNRKERGYSGEVLRKVSDRNESIAIDAIFEYIYELNGGRVQKEKFMNFVLKRGLRYEDVVKLFELIDEGEVVVGK